MVCQGFALNTMHRILPLKIECKANALQLINVNRGYSKAENYSNVHMYRKQSSQYPVMWHTCTCRCECTVMYM